MLIKLKTINKKDYNIKKELRIVFSFVFAVVILPAVQAHAKTVPITFSIEDTFDVSEDTRSPINEDVYAVPFRCEAL